MQDSQPQDQAAAAAKAQQPDKQHKPPPSYPPPPDRTAGGYVPGPPKPGYFAIYKKGQGYWTRMGTVAGAALIGLLTCDFIFNEFDSFAAQQSVRSYLSRIHLQEPRAGYLLVLVVGMVYALIVYHYLNKPHNVDFLIATDSEMKRVNWTSKKDLFGSTRVVIAFMFIIAVVLFLYDLFFQTVFWLIGVLKTPPPFFPEKH
jgi:preprotein translocase subunit SecE